MSTQFSFLVFLLSCFHVLNCLQTAQSGRESGSLETQSFITTIIHGPLLDSREKPVCSRSRTRSGAQNGSRLLNHSARFRRSPSGPLDGSSVGQEGEEGETQPVRDPSLATEFPEGKAQTLK